MSSEMIERVARANYSAMKDIGLLTFCSGQNLSDEEDHIQRLFDRMARAAIEAMREPTETMIEAGSSKGGFNHEEAQDFTPIIWRAMIAAALPFPVRECYTLRTQQSGATVSSPTDSRSADAHPWTQAATPVWALVSGFPGAQRRRRSLVILQAHIDESEDGAAFVMAGYVASAEEWAKFSDEWDEVLAAEPPIPFLKTKWAMARRPRGHFSKLKREQVDQKLESLYAVIDKYVFFEVSYVILLEPLRRIFPKESFDEASSPYYHALFGLIDVVIRRQIECGMKERIDFIFDEGRHESEEIQKVWPAIMRDSPDYIKSMIGGTPVFKPDTGIDGLRPLQAADLEAWWTRRRIREKILGIPRLEYPWQPAAIPGVSGFMGEAELTVAHARITKARAESARFANLGFLSIGKKDA